MREHDIRRIAKEVCELLDRRGKAAPIAVGLAMAIGAGCGGNVILKGDASIDSSTTTANADSGTETFVGYPDAGYMVTFDTGVPTDSAATDAADADAEVDADTARIMCLYCVMSVASDDASPR